jgi:hypothetical protein
MMVETITPRMGLALLRQSNGILSDALEVRIAGYFATGSSDNRSYASGYGEYPDI